MSMHKFVNLFAGSPGPSAAVATRSSGRTHRPRAARSPHLAGGHSHVFRRTGRVDGHWRCARQHHRGLPRRGWDDPREQWRRDGSGAGSATVANTRLIQVFGLGGNDNLSLNETNGALPKANIFGGNGNDTLTGGSGNDLLSAGRATTPCSARAATICCSAATATSHQRRPGNDAALLGAGDDTFIWNPGDGSDTVDGQAGNDTMVFNGSTPTRRSPSPPMATASAFRDVAT